MILLLLLAFGLAMDAFSLSTVTGIRIKKYYHLMALWIAFLFGLFQGGFFLVGFLVGDLVTVFLKVNHWISFIILFLVGIKMIYEALKGEEKTCATITIQTTFLFAVACSLDSLAVGFSLASSHISLMGYTLIIAIVTGVLSWSGVYLGRLGRHFLGRKMEILGGIFLLILAFQFIIF